MTPQEKDAMHLMANECAALGLYGIPLHGVEEDLTCTCGKVPCTDCGKHPRTARGLKDATRDPVQIHQWIYESGWDNLNWGIVTGEISGITVIDVDMGEGKVGAETWAELIRDHGEPVTLRQVTGSNGLHAVFQYNSALKTSSNTLGKHVDCRNDGGYIVVAPSRHKSGGMYRWDNWGCAIAPLPAHLAKKKETRGRPRKDESAHRVYTEEDAAEMLEHVDATDRDSWINVGVILGRYFKRSEKAWNVYVTWAAKDTRPKGRGHDKTMNTAFYETSQQAAENELSMGTIIALAKEGGWSATKGEVPVEQFVYSMEENAYIYLPTGKSCIAAAVDTSCSWEKGQPSLVIRSTNKVTSTTCDPNIKDVILKGFDYVEGYPKPGPGAATLNRYRPPEIALGDATLAGPFVDHVHKVFPKPGDADQFIDYMAHRRQCPGVKPHYALVIGGEMGVGKDTAVEACVDALGGWNVKEIPPTALDRDFNTYAVYTLVRISEVADNRDMSRWTFYERIKTLITSEHIEINPKYGRTYSVRLYCGVVITTNHLDGGIFMPAEDRRYDIIESATKAEMGLADDGVRETYFNRFYDWLRADGRAHVAAYLQTRDVCDFHPHVNRKTAAWHRVVQHGLSGYEWCSDALDKCKNQNMVSGSVILGLARGEDFRSQLPHAMKGLGYVLHENPRVKDHRWKLNLREDFTGRGKPEPYPPVWHRIYRRKDYYPEQGLEWQETLDKS